MTDLTNVLQAVIVLIASLLSAFVVPWLRSRTTGQQRQEMQAWVEIAVQAAEQLYQGAGRGTEKKQWVLQWLAERGYSVETEELDAMIEAAVLALNSQVSA